MAVIKQLLVSFLTAYQCDLIKTFLVNVLIRLIEVVYNIKVLVI